MIASKSARSALAGARNKSMTPKKKHGKNWRRKMKARKVFHALMSSKGYTEADLAMTGDKYTNPAMQGRWNYFLAGWEMRGVM
jgi:hypothetical protein